MEHYYQICRPTGKHRSYRVLKQWVDDQGKRRSVTVSNLTLNAINENFQSRRIDGITAEKNIKDVVKSLRIADGEWVAKSVHHEDNHKVLEDYFHKVYRRRDVIDKQTEYYSLRRAIIALGDLSILSASEEQIQDQVDQHFTGNKQRRIIDKLNLILKFIGRTDIKLLKKRPERKHVKYLTKEEMLKLLLHLPPEMQLITQVAFYTGCRTGECFALTGRHNDRVITVATQIDRKGVERETKNRRVRTVVTEPDGMSILEAWGKQKATFQFTRTQISQLFREACVKAFSNNKDKMLKFHDLRHSYAIELLNRGATIEEVAASLGDSVQVCQEYYTGFVLTSGATERLKRLTAQPIELALLPPQQDLQSATAPQVTSRRPRP